MTAYRATSASGCRRGRDVSGVWSIWARTTSDYSHAFARMREAVAAFPVDNAVLDGEAVLMRSDDTFDFEGLRSRQGQAEAILLAVRAELAP